MLKKKTCVAFCLLWAISVVFATDNKVTDLRFIKNASGTDLVVNLKLPSKPKIFSLHHPERLVVDFKNTHLAIKIAKLHPPQTLGLLSIREGYPTNQTLRLVFDFNQPIQYRTYYQANQLRINLSQKSTHIQRSTKKFIVVIDPGHGGKDPGAVGKMAHTQEKAVVLGIAQKLALLINQNPHMQAVLTRNGDYYVALRDRLVLARKGRADLFVAIHADSYFNKRANGASIYTLSEHGASSIAARWLARRENYSELGGVDLGDLEDQSTLLRSVLIDMAQTQTSKDSLYLGSSMLDALNRVTKLHYARVERAPFLVLKSPDIPSVLVETGFISHRLEEMRLRDPRFQYKIAHALYQGIHVYQQHFLAITSVS